MKWKEIAAYEGAVKQDSAFVTPISGLPSVQVHMNMLARSMEYTQAHGEKFPGNSTGLPRAWTDVYHPEFSGGCHRVLQ